MMWSGRSEHGGVAVDMTRRLVGVAVALAGLLAITTGASAGTSDGLSSSTTKTKLVLKLRGDERVSIRSRFESDPPTVVLEFPQGRVAGSLPERSSVGQGVVREIRTTYYAPSSSSAGRWIKTVNIELGGRYSYDIRQESDQIVVEIEHPAALTEGTLPVGLAGGAVIAGQVSGTTQDRFRAMQNALVQATKPAEPTRPAIAPAQARQPLASPIRPTVTTPGTSGQRQASRARLTTPRRSPLAAVWGLFALGLIGIGTSIGWLVWRQSGPFLSRRRIDRPSLAIDVIDQLVWRAFEQQGAQLQQIVQGDDATGPLRVMSKDSAKVGLQCIGGGAFFEKATVERFARALQEAGVDQGFLVAAGSFTVPAQRFAKERKITLIGREPLTELLGAGASQEYYAKQLQEINGQLQKTRDTLDEYARQLDMIRRQRNEACWLLGEERAKLSKIESEHDDLKKQAEQWYVDAEHWQQTAKLNHKKWEESQWYLGESRTFAEHLESQLGPLQESYAQLEQRVRELTDTLADMTRQRDESQWQLGETKSASESLQQQIREVEQRIGQLQERLKTVESQLDESQRNLASERMERERLQERLATFQAVGERRRAGRRYLKDAAIELHTQDGSLLFQGVPRDVSGEGVGISCDKSIALPEQATLRVEFLNGDQVLETEGRLVWNRESHDSAEQWSGYEFVDLPEEIRRAIEQLLTLPN
jgi:uncharacterized coiled-coil DUF342 family protein